MLECEFKEQDDPEVSPCVTDETGQPDKVQSNDAGIPVESWRERAV